MIGPFTRLLGKRPSDPALEEFLSAWGDEPEINEDDQGGGLFYTFKETGIELQFRYFDPYYLLATVFLFSGARDEWGYHRDYPAHCREVGPHLHCCWVVDLLLKKE